MKYGAGKREKKLCVRISRYSDEGEKKSARTRTHSFAWVAVVNSFAHVRCVQKIFAFNLYVPFNKSTLYDLNVRYARKM